MKSETFDRGEADRRLGSGDGSRKTSPHPLDEWLRRELSSLFASVQDDPLPPDLSDLAGKLERALAAPRPQKRSD